MTRNRRSLTVVAGALAVLGTLLTAVTPASASDLTYRFAPPSGQAGSTIQVIGVGCPRAGHQGAGDSFDGRLFIWKGINTTDGPLMISKSFNILDDAQNFAFSFTNWRNSMASSSGSPRCLRMALVAAFKK